MLTATGASVAESHEVSVKANGAQAFGLAAQDQVQGDDHVQERKTDAKVQAAALLGRQEEAARAARAKARAELTAKKAAEAKARAKAEAAAAASAHRWIMPLKHFTFTSGFKMRWGAMHQGNDLAIAEGTPIAAMSTGKVIFAGWMGGGGNTVKIRYWDGTVTYYEHMSVIKSGVGDAVAPGTVVGLVGNTGHSFGAHLHLEIHPNGQDAAVDPTPWLHKHGLFKGQG